jgi:hypothetical protein
MVITSRLASTGYTAIKTLEKTPVAAVLLEYKQEGMDVETIAYHTVSGAPASRSASCIHPLTTEFALVPPSKLIAG